MITLGKRRVTIEEILEAAINSGAEEATLLNTVTYKVVYAGDIGYILSNAVKTTLNQAIVASELIGSMVYVFF